MSKSKIMMFNFSLSLLTLTQPLSVCTSSPVSASQWSLFELGCLESIWLFSQHLGRKTAVAPWHMRPQPRILRKDPWPLVLGQQKVFFAFFFARSAPPINKLSTCAESNDREWPWTSILIFISLVAILSWALRSWFLWHWRCWWWTWPWLLRAKQRKGGMMQGWVTNGCFAGKKNAVRVCVFIPTKADFLLPLCQLLPELQTWAKIRTPLTSLALIAHDHTPNTQIALWRQFSSFNYCKYASYWGRRRSSLCRFWAPVHLALDVAEHLQWLCGSAGRTTTSHWANLLRHSGANCLLIHRLFLLKSPVDFRLSLEKVLLIS